MATKAKLKMLVLGISQQDIAQLMDCSPAYVSRCINGKQRPSKRLIAMMQQLTSLEAEEFFDIPSCKAR